MNEKISEWWLILVFFVIPFGLIVWTVLAFLIRLYFTGSFMP